MATVIAGCVHEHFESHLQCGQHSRLAQAAINLGMYRCRECHRAGCDNCAIRLVKVETV